MLSASLFAHSSPCARTLVRPAAQATRNVLSLSLRFAAMLWLLSITTFAQEEQPWNRLYITNFASEEVHVVDLNQNTVMARIRVGSGPAGMAVSPDLQRVYVANLWAGTVSVISTATNTVLQDIRIPCNCGQSGPFGLALLPDGTKLYVTNLNDGTVRVVDTATNTVTATITGAYDWALRYIGISPDGEYVWAVGTGDGKLSVIRTSDNQVVARITGLPSARHLSFSPDGSRVYVTGEKYHRLYVLDTKTYELIKVFQFPNGSGTITVDVCTSGKFAVVSNFYGKPTIIDTDPKSPTYHTILQEIQPKSSYQYCIVTAQDGRFAYLTNQSDRGQTPNSLNIIDLRPESPTRFSIINSIPLGLQPWGIAIVRQPPNPLLATSEKTMEASAASHEVNHDTPPKQ